LDHTRRFVATGLSKRVPPVEPLRKTSTDRTDMPRMERSLMPRVDRPILPDECFRFCRSEGWLMSAAAASS